MKLSCVLPVAVLIAPGPVLAQGSPGHVRPTRPPERSGFLAARHLRELETPASATSGVFVTGDLDGDGDVDLLTCEWTDFAPFFGAFWDPTGIQTWLNSGSGEFTLAHVLRFDPWDRGLIELAQQAYLADVTGDGVPDLAYDRHDTRGLVPSGVLVHAGLGDGSFGAGLLIASVGQVQAFLVGDADGDGDADVLVHDTAASPTDGRDTLTWWRLENGAFQPGARLVLDTDVPLRIAACDTDGDGITDVLGGTFSGYDLLQVFRTVGGAPQLVTTVPLAGEFHNIDQRHLAGDVDGDGLEDLVLKLNDLSADLFRLQVFRGTGVGFDPLPSQAFVNDGFDRAYTREAVLADWDGDGDLDLVSPTFAWLENVDGTRFEPAGSQLSSWTGNGNRSPMHVADLDGDGHLDALAHRMVYPGDGTFPRRTSVPPYLGILSTSWSAVEDWEGDGDLDLTSLTRLELNNGDGTFVVRSTPHATAGFLVAWGDFDGDGLRDALRAVYEYGTFREMVLLKGTQDGPYVLAPLVPASVEMPAGSLSGDLDGDGDVDVLSTDGYWPNDGTGRFGARVTIAFGTPLLARDGDGDGDLDLVVSHLGSSWYLENLGGLDFRGTNLGPHDPEEPPTLLDADQDGDLDFLVARASSWTVEIREQLDSGFAAPLVLAAPGLNGPLGLGDVDGDRRPELLASRTTPLNIGAIQLLVAWHRAEGLDYPTRTEWVTRDPALAFADFDGDGDVEARGRRTFENLLYDAPEDGTAVQYGLDAATSGTGGRRPLLGSHGPVRRVAHLVIAHGRGRAAGVLLAGTSRADVSDNGFRRLVDGATIARMFTLGGTPNVAGAGSLTLALPVNASLVGRTLVFQAVLVDPGAPAGLSATNGLEVRFADLSSP